MVIGPRNLNGVVRLKSPRKATLIEWNTTDATPGTIEFVISTHIRILGKITELAVHPTLLVLLRDDSFIIFWGGLICNLPCVCKVSKLTDKHMGNSTLNSSVMAITIFINTTFLCLNSSHNVSDFIAKPMLPFILSLPAMKACCPFNLPLLINKSEVFINAD